MAQLPPENNSDLEPTHGYSLLASVIPPAVSVICIFFNAELFLFEAVQSVLSQSFENFELLLVDDGSTDAGSAIAIEFAEEHPNRIRYFHHRGHINRGMSASRNLGLQHARGKFVAFIDADDRWRRSKLSEQVAILQAHDEVGMVCGSVNYWESWRGGRDRLKQTGHLLNRVSTPPETSLRVYPLGDAHAPCPSDVLLRRSIIGLIGCFEEEFSGPLQMYEDQAFLAKLYLHVPVYFSSRTWSDYRIHDESCVAVVERDGLYTTVREYFLDWLHRYVDENDIAYKFLIYSAIQRARWELKHPKIRRLLRLGRRALSIVEKVQHA